MAYRVKKEDVKYEELEIELSDGSIKTYYPHFSLDTVAKQYRDFMNKISFFNETDFENYDGDYYAELGKAVCQLLEMIFDAEQVVDMLNTFDGKYFELFGSITPYLNNVIEPIIIKENEKRVEYYSNVLK